MYDARVRPIVSMSNFYAMASGPEFKAEAGPGASNRPEPDYMYDPGVFGITNGRRAELEIRYESDCWWAAWDSEIFDEGAHTMLRWYCWGFMHDGENPWTAMAMIPDESFGIGWKW